MRLFYKLAILSVVLIFSFQTKATHYVGSDLTYRCIDAQGNYEVTLVLYRDCGPGTATLCSSTCGNIATCTQIVEVWGADISCAGTKFASITLNGQSVRDVNPNPNCASAKSTCDNLGCVIPGSMTPAVERYEFKGTVNIGASSGIPASCCNIRFAYSNCCRNGAIQNITAGNFYSEAVVNRCLSTFPDCNSPVSANDPFEILCFGQGVRYNTGAFDPDFDSLSYALSPAMESYGVSSTYISPYSYVLPFPYTAPVNGVYPAGFSCNPSTGIVAFKPNSYPFYGVMAIEIAQWRKISGTFYKVGTTRRDMQIYIKLCNPNNSPSFVTIPAGVPAVKPITDYTACVGTQLCFNVQAKDTDALDTTYLTWDKNMVQFGATFTPLYNAATRSINGPRQDSFRFCWTPTAAMAKPFPYLFSIKAIDNKCPYPGKMMEAFNITVPMPVQDVSISINTATCGSATLSHNNLTQTIASRQWRVSKTPGIMDTLNMSTSSSLSYNTTFPKPGKFPIQLIINIGTSCNISRIFYDTVTITNALNSTVSNDTTVCSSKSFKVSLLQPDTIIRKLRWYALPDVTNAIDTTASYTVTPTTTKNYMLVITDKNSCTYRDTCTVKVARMRASYTVNKLNQCIKGNSYVFTNASTDSASGTFTLLWKFSTGDSATTSPVNKTYTTLGDYSFTLYAKSNLGCIDSISVNYKIMPSPTAAYKLMSDSIQCQGTNSYTWLNQSTMPGDSLSYLWRYDFAATSTDVNPTYHFTGSGVYAIRLTAISKSNGCRDSVERTVFVQEGAVARFFINDTTQCLRNNGIGINNASYMGVGTLTYLWNFGDNGTSTLFNPTHVYVNAGIYSVKLLATPSTGSCKDSANVKVYIYEMPKSTFAVSGDSSQCLSKNNFVFINQSQITGDSLIYNWNFGNSTNSALKNPLPVVYAATGSYPVKLISTSMLNACRDTVTRIMKVNAEPKAGFSINNNMQCKPGNNFVFTNSSTLSQGSFGSKWNFGDTLFATQTNASHTYNNAGAYTVWLTVKSDGSCSDSISKLINVLDKPVASFTKDAAIHCIGEPFIFTNTTTIQSGNFSLRWLTGDGNTYTDSVVLHHLYTTTGLYKVYLVASSGSQCNDTATQQVTMNARPQKPSIFGDSLAPKRSTRNYLTNANSGSTWTWGVYGDTLEVARQLPFTGNQATIVWGNTDTGIVAVVEKNSSNCVSDTNYLLVGLTPRTALNEIDALGDLRIYPQPATDKLYLSGRILSTILRIEIFTTEGKLIHQYNRDEIARGAFPLHDISNGMYIMQVSNEREILGVRRISIVK